MPTALTAAGLSKRFGDQLVLGEVDLEARAGELVAIVGPSGCGKSTLLRIVAGLERSSGGRVLFRDGDAEVAQPRIGLAFQDPALFPWRTARENVELGLELAGVPRSERRATARELLDAFGLGPCEDRLPRELSGGMKQRVALARALATQPDVLLVDEPFSAVDDRRRESLQEWLVALRRRWSVTTLFVTHSVPEAVFLADRIVVLSPAPASIEGVVDVRVAHPRERGGAPAAELEKQVRALLAPAPGPRRAGRAEVARR